MPLHFVTGPAGAGTTTAVRELGNRGYLAYDTDDQDQTGMFAWHTRYTGLHLFGYNELAITNGKDLVTAHGVEKTIKTLDDHIWRPTDFAIGKLTIESQIDLMYVCGQLEKPEPIINISRMSGDKRDGTDGKIVFLSIDEDTIRSRLSARVGDADAPEWGKAEWQRDDEVAANAELIERYQAMGAIMLDGEKSIDNVVDDIVFVTTR